MGLVFFFHSLVILVKLLFIQIEGFIGLQLYTKPIDMEEHFTLILIIPLKYLKLVIAPYFLHQILIHVLQYIRANQHLIH